MSIEKEYNDIVECIKQQKPIKELRYALAEYALKKPALIAEGIYSLSQGSWFEEVPRYDVPVIVCFCDPQSEFRGCGDGEIGRKYTSDDVPILIRGVEYRMNDPNGNLGFLILKDPYGNFTSAIHQNYVPPMPVSHPSAQQPIQITSPKKEKKRKNGKNKIFLQ